MAQDREAWYK
ncbi:uncharacterized protein FRV6_16934 [Fusarium oxysporum]|uniref:Uncharacterized protein n=1 Tax=Fusarium oxysporum TaxID=5507 RepID=A0A2H3UC49_FUSOX|nr:uncharacterized protein FRV6_16934 [Fusarium oxysporum]